MYLINVFLGFFIMQIADILKRDKESAASPVKFSYTFFFKDNWLKILLSLILSVLIAVAVKLNFSTVHEAFSGNTAIGVWIYIIIGAVPEYALQLAKKKLGFAQPEKVITKGEVFERK